MTSRGRSSEIHPIPRPNRRSGADLPFISVVVPVRNEARFIEGTIEQLVGQDYPADRFEVLVVDGRSTDSTREIVAAMAAARANVRLLDNPGRLSSAARNIGLREAGARSSWSSTATASSKVRGYLRDVADAFERSGADCLGRPQPLDVTDASPLAGGDRGRPVVVAGASPRLVHLLVRRTVRPRQERRGRLPPPRLRPGGPVRRVVRRLRGRRAQPPDRPGRPALLLHARRSGFATSRGRACVGLFHQLARYGRGRVRLIRKHPETFSAGGFIPAAWLAGLVDGPAGRPGLAPPLVGLSRRDRPVPGDRAGDLGRRGPATAASSACSAGSPWSS